MIELPRRQFITVVRAGSLMPVKAITPEIPKWWPAGVWVQLEEGAPLQRIALTGATLEERLAEFAAARSRCLVTKEIFETAMRSRCDAELAKRNRPTGGFFKTA